MLRCALSIESRNVILVNSTTLIPNRFYDGGENSPKHSTRTMSQMVRSHYLTKIDCESTIMIDQHTEDNDKQETVRQASQ